MSELEKLSEYEERIRANISDDERAHILEDEAMVYFIRVAHHLNKDQIIEAQKIFNRIDAMDFSRWCA